MSAEAGWDQLRREIEALPGWRLDDEFHVQQADVLAIVDRLAAIPLAEPAIEWDPTKPEADQPMWQFWLLVSPFLVVMAVAIVGAFQAIAAGS